MDYIPVLVVFKSYLRVWAINNKYARKWTRWLALPRAKAELSARNKEWDLPWTEMPGDRYSKEGRETEMFQLGDQQGKRLCAAAQLTCSVSHKQRLLHPANSEQMA